MKDGICIKCNSRKMIRSLRIIEYGYYNKHPNELSARIDQQPSAWIFKETYNTPLQAWICGDCDYTEFYVENPPELYQAYRVSKVNAGLSDPLNETQ